jgi:hypothetical protein
MSYLGNSGIRDKPCDGSSQAKTTASKNIGQFKWRKELKCSLSRIFCHVTIGYGQNGSVTVTIIAKYVKLDMLFLSACRVVAASNFLFGGSYPAWCHADQIKSNQIKSNQIKSNSNQIDYNTR